MDVGYTVMQNLATFCFFSGKSQSLFMLSFDISWFEFLIFSKVQCTPVDKRKASSNI